MMILYHSVEFLDNVDAAPAAASPVSDFATYEKSVGW